MLDGRNTKMYKVRLYEIYKVHEYNCVSTETHFFLLDYILISKFKAIQQFFWQLQKDNEYSPNVAII